LTLAIDSLFSHTMLFRARLLGGAVGNGNSQAMTFHTFDDEQAGEESRAELPRVFHGGLAQGAALRKVA